MNSTRLPGKILLKIMSRPLLSYQVERLRLCRRIDDIIIATTTNEEDDPVTELAQNEGLKCYRGSEDDVLDRYYRASRKYNVKHIMRITGDCPLVQADICDRIVDVYFNSGADYVHTGETFAEGLDCEVVSFHALSQVCRGERLKSEHEHVTLYIRNHPEKFRIITVENETDDSKYRITVDEKEDFLVVKAIFENLYAGKDRCFTIGEVKSFLDMHPEICKQNAHITRNEGFLKSLEADKYDKSGQLENGK